MARRQMEIELVCANAEFIGEKKCLALVSRYLKLQRDFPGKVRVKEPEADVDYCYKECSIYTTQDKLPWWKSLLARRGLKIDLIHSGSREVRV